MKARGKQFLGHRGLKRMGGMYHMSSAMPRLATRLVPPRPGGLGETHLRQALDYISPAARSQWLVRAGIAFILTALPNGLGLRTSPTQCPKHSPTLGGIDLTSYVSSAQSLDKSRQDCSFNYHILGERELRVLHDGIFEQCRTMKRWEGDTDLDQVEKR